MIINGKTIDPHSLSKSQLERISDALEAFYFRESHLFIRGEPFSPTITKNRDHFKKLISLMVAFKRRLAKYFQDQYNNRDNLIRMGAIKAAESSDDMYLYLDQWDDEDEVLLSLLEEFKRMAYDLGVAALVDQSGKDSDHYSYDAGKVFVKKIKVTVTGINEVTRKRIIQAIKDSIDLGENREAFEKRIQKILVNPYRGRMIAQNEAMESYLTGKDTAAKESDQFTKKTWRGVQPDKTEICGSVLDETVGINETFSNGLDGPPPHLNCKCDLEYS